jgi:hypothetical protein
MNWIGMIIGAAIGYGFYYLVRCQGGTCPLTSTWWVTTIIGAVFGLTWPKASKSTKPPEESGDE